MKTIHYYKEKFSVFLENFSETGYVELCVPPIVYVRGLPSVCMDEVVIFESGDIGVVRGLSNEYVEVLMITSSSVPVGYQVARSGTSLNIEVGDDLLGNTMTPLGHSMYKNKPIPPMNISKKIDIAPMGIKERKKILRPLETGVAVVDLMIPLGKGQRELLIGDRKTGKTQFALQTMYSQYLDGSICIYAGIGREATDIKKVEAYFNSKKMWDRSIIIASTASDPLGMIFITPYVAMTLAEYFRDKKKDVILILDDLTTHAKYYREISLLSKKFPGRSSYPADIFYTHSRLLERAGNFVVDDSEAALTCLPVVNTVGSDISGYIQTNLMSITDGHIYFDSDWFANGIRPAINYFLSVTRVGRQTQSSLRWGINRELNSFLTLYQKTESFVHFGAELNEGVKATMAMGTMLKRFFDQPMTIVLPLDLQILIFCLIWLGIWNTKSSEYVDTIIDMIINEYNSNDNYRKELTNLLNESKDFNMFLGMLGSKTSLFIDTLPNITQLNQKEVVKTPNKSLAVENSPEELPTDAK